MYCSKCGKEIPEGSVYCNYCGNQINTENTNKKDSPDDETYKVCPSCAKPINKEAVICPKCGVQIKELKTAHTIIDKPRDSQTINLPKRAPLVTTYKRPISIVLVVLLGVGFFSIFTSLSAVGNTELAIIIYFPIFIFITFILIFVNLGKNRNRMLGFVIATCVMAVILAGVSISYSFKSKNTQSGSILEETSQTELTTNIVEEIQESTQPSVKEDAVQLEETNNQIVAPIILTGKGNQSTDFFNLEGVYTFVDFEGSGFLNPIKTDILNENGDVVQSINTVLLSSFYEPVYLKEGEYFLNIEADGTWKITITQYLPSESQLPYVFIGDSKNLSDLLIINGLAEIQYDYQGTSYFSVYLLNEFLETEEILVGETSSNAKNGSTTYKGNGKYFISVQSGNGYYKIKVFYK